MTKNAKLFKEYLIKNNLNLEFSDEDNDTYIEIRETLKSGIKVRIGIVFNEDDTLISIYVIDLVTIMDISKKNLILNKINELNNHYSILKFTFEDNSIQINTFIPVKNNFKAEIIMDYLLGLYKIIENEYPVLMKIVWS